MGRYYTLKLTRGIGSNPQFNIINLIYEDLVNQLQMLDIFEDDDITKLDRLRFNDYKLKKGISELEKAGVKFKKEDVIFVTKTKNKELVWLEKGNSIVGLQHIIEGHEEDFNKYLNIKKSKIPDKIEEIVSSWDRVSKKIKDVGGRDGYEMIHKNKNDYVVIVALGTNGFIVSAYPKGED